MSTACLVGLACFVTGLEDPWLFSADQGLGPSNRPGLLASLFPHQTRPQADLGDSL